MPEKIEAALLNRLLERQNSLTLSLTDRLIEQYFDFPAEIGSTQAAFLQRWVALLVQSLFEGIKTGQTDLVADFVVVLRGEGAIFYRPDIWRFALVWLGQRCHSLLKPPVLLGASASFRAVHSELDEDFYDEFQIRLANLLNKLDKALRLGFRELERPQRLPQSSFHLPHLEVLQPSLHFSLN